MESFDGFVRQHGAALTKVAYLLSGDPGHAEDLVQVTYLKVYKSWEKVSQADYPLAYARTILTREYLTWRRRRSNSEVPTEVPTEAPFGTQDAAEDPSDAITEREAVWTLLATLTKRQRAVLVLRFYLDMNDAQISDALGCSEGSVRSHASRGLAALREPLGDRLKEILT